MEWSSIPSIYDYELLHEMLQERAFDLTQTCDIKLVLYDLAGTKLEVNWMESSNDKCRAWQMRFVPSGGKVCETNERQGEGGQGEARVGGQLQADVGRQGGRPGGELSPT